MASYNITSKEKNGDVYYTVNWSPLEKADRYTIISKVPAVAGIFEIYWMDDHKKLRMFKVDKIIYGGLRSELRRLTDPELNRTDEKVRKILEEKEIYYRYAATDSNNIMDDVIWFFMKTYFPDVNTLIHSGRYNAIYLKESEPDKLLWVP